MPGRALPTFEISADEREALDRWIRRPKTAQALALRARIVFACECVNAEGETVISGEAEVLAPTKKVRRARAVLPEVRLLDEEGGVLELVSPVNRTDWNHDGRLAYRGRWYGLELVDREGRG